MAERKSVVIVGAGQAAAWAARTLRQKGSTDRIVMIGREAHSPYERPPLSKSFLLGESTLDKAMVFPPSTYEELGIELRLSTQVEALDPDNGSIRLNDGTSLGFNQLLLATGGTPRRIATPGADRQNVFHLRDAADALALGNALRQGGRLLVIGGGWIGLEVAAAARKLGLAVTLVEAGPRLCGRGAPTDLSEWLLALHTANGVDVRLGTVVTELDGVDRAEQARLSTGETLEVSAVLVGIGLVPATELAERAGLLIDNGIVVDERWMTSAEGIFAAGDVAAFRAASGRLVRHESWDNAQKHGLAAALGMLGEPGTPDPWPWFWSDQYGANIQLVGDFSSFDQVIPLPCPGQDALLRLYLDRGSVVGAMGIDAGRDFRLLKRALDTGRASQVANDALSGHSLKEVLKP
jgi:3-phenylpropionate/trans-cinnamate dioxygenase ferredoxin reductase subunit